MISFPLYLNKLSVSARLFFSFHLKAIAVTYPLHTTVLNTLQVKGKTHDTQLLRLYHNTEAVNEECCFIFLPYITSPKLIP